MDMLSEGGRKNPGSIIDAIERSDRAAKEPAGDEGIPEDESGELHVEALVLGKRAFSRARVSAAESIRNAAGDSRLLRAVAREEGWVPLTFLRGSTWSNRQSMLSTCLLTVGRAIE